MADDVDFANDLASEEMQAILSAHRKTISESEASESEEFCEDCGDEIPEERRRRVKGVKTCVDCQSIREHPSRRVIQKR